MLISLIGYMGCGKTHISKLLSKRLNFKGIDLDMVISENDGLSVSEIFQTKGELYFRKRERALLETLLKSEKETILSLGGGTPVYYNNIEIINEFSVSIYLRTNIPTLTERLLRQKSKRPLIAKLNDEDIPEYIAKHLFERNPYYNQAYITVDTDNKKDTEIVEEIVEKLTALHHLPSTL
ncbi:MAG: shikimate kinase [Bergeyella sp.]